jgi:ABC-2 type transport system permease protein
LDASLADSARQIELVNYPYFVDVRADGLQAGQAPTAGLSQLTLSWAAPIGIDGDKAKGRKVTCLIQSSNRAWASDESNVLPDFSSHSELGFAAGREKGRQLLGAMMDGQFTSFFAGKASPLAKDEAAADAKDKAAKAGDAAAESA